MTVTPLIKPVQDKKGILYNFQSALEDINTTISNTDNAVRFSKFALLKIPIIGTPDYLPTDNKLQFLAQGETPLIDGLNADNNVNLAQSFQNYALNLESLLISRPQYKREAKKTIAERVFWKWIKELGGIRFQDANAFEVNSDSTSEKRFVEKPETNSTYDKIVKYIGEIDVVNTVKSTRNSYTEVYVYVPTNVGTTPHVLFKSNKDDNYYPSMTIANNADDPLNIEYLSGRQYNEVHPFGLSMKAFYDLDDASATAQIKNNISDPYTIGNWFTQTVKNAYYTDNYNSTGEFNVADDQVIFKQLGTTTVEYQRSTLDGIELDFDLSNYKLASENPEISVFSQFNDYVANRDFEFNAILLYYDTYDPNNLDENGQPIDIETNLYGVQFLDKIQQSGLEFQIPVITKFKPDPLSKVNGTAYAFKSNLKLDNSVENVLVERSINDYSTFSLELFTDVLTQFKELQAGFQDSLLEMTQLKQELAETKDLLINTETADELEIRLSNVETSLEENSAIFDNTNSIVRMIESTNDKVDSIISGDSNISVSYDTDALRPGSGIFINRKTPNRIRIENINEDYNISNNSLTNLFTNNVIELSKYKNYIAHQNSGQPIVLIKDLEIFINDETNPWKKGQALRLVFDDEFTLGIYDIKIYTDSQNITNNGEYGILVNVLSSVDFAPDDKPIFDIICLDANNLTFKIDKIR